MNRQKHRRIIISGGGTGGHVFPAISIANALKRIDQDTEILFVGAAEAVEEEAAEEEAAEFEDVFAPVVIRQETYHGEPLTVEEAIELLRQQRLDYLLFPNKRDGRITLVYERPDGNYGLVEAP